VPLPEHAFRYSPLPAEMNARCAPVDENEDFTAFTVRWTGLPPLVVPTDSAAYPT